MITFKNIAGNKLLAVGTIQRKSALNGEKSLTGTLYDGKDVLNKIDKGWSLEFDGEPYVVTYFERNDNDNSVSFDAIHKFFWDMAKKVLYSSTEISGSHTIKWYLDQIFANTGYTYALNFNPAAIEKDNWGNKTRLSLFNDLITSIAGEFEINGTLISIFQNIGTDLSTIVRYGFNLSDMTIENDATGFVTYGEGFGAYADQQNQTGDRVHVTYTSPLAGVYGILQAEPIDDQRYTSQANLQAAVKAQVDASFSVSVQLSLYDLTAAGYPYKMANVGDWLTAVDENLDFKQRIRIISIDDEFSADGTRISYTVTAGDVGLTKKYQDANASMSSQIANAVNSASQASTDANNALISANGKNTSYYLNSVDDLPTTANEGDLAWIKSGDGTVMYIYTKKADGSYYWEKRIDPEMGDQIASGVTEAVAQANAHTDEVKQVLSTDIDTARSQATSQASTAEANAKSAATSQFNQAQNDLAQAKTDITNAYKTADGVVNKKIDDTASSITTTINQNKQDADGKISTAQTTATTALNGLSSKVSQTDYDTKTGQLTTSVSKAQQTADAATTSLASYKQDADGRISANSADIVTNANAIKQKVAQSDYDANNTKLTSRLTTVETTANGTATTVSNLQQTVNSLGQTNLINNSEFSPDLQGWSVEGSGTYTAGDYDYSGAVLVLANTGGGIVSLYSSPVSLNGSSSMTISWKLNYYIFSVGTNGSSYIYLQYLDSRLNPIPNVFIHAQNVAGSSGKGWTNYIVNNLTLTNMPAGAKYIRLVVDAREKGSKIGINKPMLILGTSVGAYVAGAYNNNAAIAQVKITADGISNFVRDSSGNISSNFQTALSKTSIITGSTLATSIQTQTATQIASALTDNNGKIISLINQDSSGVQIAGKNIVLNGDTTVTGAFKVSQANIANGAIGTAQIGDASITNAKIADLDVSKITGNVTNFIQSYWNGVYESTTITNDGMQIVTSDIITTFGPYGINLTQGGESVGGIGVSSYVGMPTNFQGIAFNLDGTGDYMTWGARESGVTTGNYTTKLAWFRSSYKPSGQNSGFNFSSDSPVTFWGSIYGRDNTEPLKIDSFGMNGISAGGIGHNNGNSAITFGGDGEIYAISGGTYYRLAKLVKALQPLVGMGLWSVPKNIDSSGTVTKWTNITT
ncbi:MAG: phage tail protein [Leuconostoc pseudomesenteroides]|uniref:phage tail protein n=1 Tax=Leuconostoc pseudomesenteroides TaxID=33968 RepID=UPI0039E8472C